MYTIKMLSVQLKVLCRVFVWAHYARLTYLFFFFVFMHQLPTLKRFNNNNKKLFMHLPVHTLILLVLCAVTIFITIFWFSWSLWIVDVYQRGPLEGCREREADGTELFKAHLWLRTIWSLCNWCPWTEHWTLSHQCPFFPKLSNKAEVIEKSIF